MTGRFCNVILCEDIRNEVGSKQSLMGVFSGDIVVPTLPAAIQIALFTQFIPDDEGKDITFDMRLMLDKDEIAKAKLQLRVPEGNIVNAILPRGVLQMEKECVFRVCASVNARPEIEILSKKIILGTVSV